jgi:excisionase family DNA binding protein
MREIFPSDTDDRLLKMHEVARWLAVAESTIYKWIKDGHFPQPVTLGKETDSNSASRFFKSEVEEWLYARPRGKFLSVPKTLVRATRMRKDAQADRRGSEGAAEGDES